MFNRREFGGMVGGAALWPGMAQAAPSVTPFYASVGPDLHRYDLDTEAATLTLRATTTLPSAMQYGWPSPSKRFLYAVTSRDPMGALKTSLGGHTGLALRIDPATGALTPHGPTVSLPQRPIHMSLDRSGRFMLTAYNTPAHVTVHRIESDGTIGAEVPQADNLDLGVYAHQIRATPSNHTVTLVDLGVPGGLKVLGFEDGKLRNIASYVPDGDGPGYGPRHLDFDPLGRFVYVSLQKNNRMDVYGLKPDGTLTAQPLFRKNCLGNPDNAKLASQGPGPIHAHPNGRIVYIANRSSKTVNYQGQRVFVGGENNIAVFAIDPQSGEPTLIQTADTHSLEPRTFALDPSNKILVTASQLPLLVRDGDKLTTVSAGITVYRIGDDSKLTFVRKYDVDVGADLELWCGTLTMA